MGLLDILAKKEKELKEKGAIPPSPSVKSVDDSSVNGNRCNQNNNTSTKEFQKSDNEEDRRNTEENENSESNDDDDDDDDDGWIETSNTPKKAFRPPELLETKIIKIEPERLVWATYYRMAGKFCARICENSEASTEPSIKEWPIPAEKAVVEIFCQERLKTTARLLLVQKSKLFPFWARTADDDEDEYDSSSLRQWNKHRMVDMLKNLRSNYSKVQAEYIYNKIKQTAEEFLRLALEDTYTGDFHQDSKFVDVEDNSESVSTTIDNIQEEQLKNQLMKYVLPPSKSNQRTKLNIGDMISYVHKAFPDRRMVTKIVGFTNDRKSPLELENGEVLLLTDVIRVHQSDEKYQTVELNHCIFGDLVFSPPREKSKPRANDLFDEDDDFILSDRRVQEIEKKKTTNAVQSSATKTRSVNTPVSVKKKKVEVTHADEESVQKKKLRKTQSSTPKQTSVTSSSSNSISISSDRKKRQRSSIESDIDDSSDSSSDIAPINAKASNKGRGNVVHSYGGRTLEQESKIEINDFKRSANEIKKNPSDSLTSYRIKKKAKREDSDSEMEAIPARGKLYSSMLSS